MEQDNKQAQLMQMKLSLMETTRTIGWSFIERFSETIVRDLEKQAIEEEDDTKANGLRRDARGARKFKDELFRRIDLAKSLEEAPTKDNFVEVVME